MMIPRLTQESSNRGTFRTARVIKFASEFIFMIYGRLIGLSLLLTWVAVYQQRAAAASPAAANPPVPVGAKATPNPEPFLRRVTLPALKLLPAGQQLPILFDPRGWRFSHLCIVGTWNKSTQVVHQYFQKHIQFFEKYKIATVAAFSHDTPENIAAWAERNKPRYLFGLAQTEFVDKLNNPKVPTCWLLTREGQIVIKHEVPTEQNLLSVYQKLRQWTEF